MGLLVRSVQFASKQKTQAFTFIELLVVLAIIAILSTITYFIVSRVQYSADNLTSIDRILTTIQSQRIHAMLGDSISGVKASPQAIYFKQGTNTYITFSCQDTYNCEYIDGSETNIEYQTEPTLVFSDITLPNNSIVFTPLSGEVSGFDPDHNKIEITNTQDKLHIDINITSIGTTSTTP